MRPVCYGRRMAKARSKEKSPRARRRSDRRSELLAARVRESTAHDFAVAFPGLSMSDRLRLLIDDAVKSRDIVEELCREWTAAQECGDWARSELCAAVLAQESRLRIMDLVQRMQELAQSE